MADKSGRLPGNIRKGITPKQSVALGEEIRICREFLERAALTDEDRRKFAARGTKAAYALYAGECYMTLDGTIVQAGDPKKG